MIKLINDDDALNAFLPKLSKVVRDYDIFGVSECIAKISFLT